MDIEGSEYESLLPLFAVCHARFAKTGLDDCFPSQIAIEIRTQSPMFELNHEAMLAFSNYVWNVGGYVVAHRKDNPDAYLGSEFLLVRVNCAAMPVPE